MNKGREEQFAIEFKFEFNFKFCLFLEIQISTMSLLFFKMCHSLSYTVVKFNLILGFVYLFDIFIFKIAFKSRRKTEKREKNVIFHLTIFI